MKIIYLHQYFNKANDPGPTRSLEIARRLLRNQYDVTIISTIRPLNSDFKSADLGKWLKENYQGIELYRYKSGYQNNSNFSKRIFYFLEYAFKSIIKIKALVKPGDIIYATSTPLTVGIIALFFKKFFKIRYVFEVRDLWPEMPIAAGYIKNKYLIKFLTFIEKAIYENSEHIIALSPGMHEGILKYVPWDKVTVSTNSCDLELFMDKYSSNRRLIQDYIPANLTGPYLLYAGSYGYLNDVSYFFKLSNALHNIGSKLNILLIGDGLDIDDVREFAKANQFRNFFHLESIPKNQIPIFYKNACFVSCVFRPIKEMEKNSSNKFFDGLAAGKPIFINFGGWMHEIITTQGNGISGYQKSFAEVASLLDSAMKDSSLISSMEKKSFLLAKNEFDRDIQFSKILKVVNRLKSN